MNYLAKSIFDPPIELDLSSKMIISYGCLFSYLILFDSKVIIAGITYYSNLLIII